MINAADIVAQLKANKTRQTPAAHTRRTTPAKRKPKAFSKPLGKYVGHCPKCTIAIGNEELGQPCRRCGHMVTEEWVTIEANTEALRTWRHHAPWGDSSMPCNGKHALIARAKELL